MLEKFEHAALKRLVQIRYIVQQRGILSAHVPWPGLKNR